MNDNVKVSETITVGLSSDETKRPEVIDGAPVPEVFQTTVGTGSTEALPMHIVESRCGVRE